ncbi:MAG: spore protease YyaC, partial [Clostridiales bacterium]|uniref:Spore protease YyaC n=2 Tax=Clostridium isatidis TaxID=182773 RepID=A0A343JET9_9CLOT|nr:spore protease YyaC [Clostridium isatidis]NLZ35673.1 spore protease YyaC [Clostridiales bacterium]
MGVKFLKSKFLYNSFNSHIEMAKLIKNFIKKNTIIVCIGTDKCIIDCLGPLVGTILKEKNIELPVYGTIQNPIHAANLKSKLREIMKIHPNSFIIGIDACLGEPEAIGEIHVRDYPIHPGKGVGKILPEVGNVSIVGIIDSNEHSNFIHIHTVRLNFVFEMAYVISNAILEAYNNFNKENKKQNI